MTHVSQFVTVQGGVGMTVNVISFNPAVVSPDTWELTQNVYVVWVVSIWVIQLSNPLEVSRVTQLGGFPPCQLTSEYVIFIKIIT